MAGNRLQITGNHFWCDKYLVTAYKWLVITSGATNRHACVTNHTKLTAALGCAYNGGDRSMHIRAWGLQKICWP